MEHPADDVLLRFVLGATSRQENRQVVRHLLSRCPACAVTLRSLWQEPPIGPPPDPGAYDEAFDRLGRLITPLRRRECQEPAGPSARNGFPQKDDTLISRKVILN